VKTLKPRVLIFVVAYFAEPTIDKVVRSITPISPSSASAGLLDGADQ
jgi:hypothetical protein